MIQLINVEAAAISRLFSFIFLQRMSDTWPNDNIQVLRVNR